jgi:hypothetical protein
VVSWNGKGSDEELHFGLGSIAGRRGLSMITAVVRFKLPKGTTLDDAKTMFSRSAPDYEAVPGLIRKYYIFGEDGTGGGIYLWDTREAAEHMFSNEWRRRIEERYGSAPEVTYYETPVIVDNERRADITALGA